MIKLEDGDIEITDRCEHTHSHVHRKLVDVVFSFEMFHVYLDGMFINARSHVHMVVETHRVVFFCVFCALAYASEYKRDTHEWSEVSTNCTRV